MTTAERPRRVSLKVEAIPDSMEAKLLNHIKEDAIAPSREIVLRALKAFYLPWALEGEVSDADLRNLAQAAVEELQFRIFQINQRYLAGESSSYQPPMLPKAATNGAAPLPPPLASNGVALSAPLETFRQSINPADLDDF